MGVIPTDISGFTQILFKYAINPFLWVLIILGMFAVALIALKIRHRRRLWYPVAEVVNLGGGKTNINFDMRAGYFGKKTFLRGLWWSGEEVLKTSTGDIIELFSTEDFQEVNGKRGIVCYRDPVRRNILFPINKLTLENEELIAAVAPADYTDAAIDIYKDAQRETTDWKDKALVAGLTALVIVFALVSIIVIVQMVSKQQDKAAEMVTMGANVCGENVKQICAEAITQALSYVKGTAGVGGVAP